MKFTISFKRWRKRYCCIPSHHHRKNSNLLWNQAQARHHHNDRGQASSAKKCHQWYSHSYRTEPHNLRCERRSSLVEQLSEQLQVGLLPHHLNQEPLSEPFRICRRNAFIHIRKRHFSACVDMTTRRCFNQFLKNRDFVGGNTKPQVSDILPEKPKLPRIQTYMRV